MQLTMFSADLKRLASAAGETAPRKSEFLIITHLRLAAEAGADSVQVTATDLETLFTGEYPARVDEPGVVCLPAARLAEIASLAPSDEVSLASLADGRMGIEAGSARYRLAGLGDDTWPEPPADTGGLTGLRLPASGLAEVLAIVAPAMSRDHTRFNLAAVFVQRHGEGGLVFAATDGHRLAVVTREGLGAAGLELGAGLLIPRSAVGRLQKMCGQAGDDTVLLELGPGAAALTVDHLESQPVVRERLVARGVQGQFPDYTVVIPTGPGHRLTVGRATLAEALKRVALMATREFRGVRLSAADDLLSLEALCDTGRAEESMAVNYQGPPVAVGVNAGYLLDFCAALGSDELSLVLADSKTAIKITGEGDPGFTGVIMPLQM